MDPLTPFDEALSLSILAEILSKAIGLTFASAVFAKVSGLRTFVAGIRSYQLVPDRLAGSAAAVLIAAETTIAIAHISGMALHLVSAGTLFLLCVFLVVTATALVRGQERPCLCFGADRADRVDGYSLVRLTVILLGETTIYFYYRSNNGHSTLSTEVLDDINVLLVSASLAALASLILSMPRLWRVRRVLDV